MLGNFYCRVWHAVCRPDDEYNINVSLPSCSSAFQLLVPSFRPPCSQVIVAAVGVAAAAGGGVVVVVVVVASLLKSFLAVVSTHWLPQALNPAQLQAMQEMLFRNFQLPEEVGRVRWLWQGSLVRRNVAMMTTSQTKAELLKVIRSYS